jgi:hypothetical protein
MFTLLLETRLFRNLCVDLRECFVRRSVAQVYSQPLDRLDLAKNPRFFDVVNISCFPCLYSQVSGTKGTTTVKWKFNYGCLHAYPFVPDGQGCAEYGHIRPYETHADAAA